MYKLFQIDSKCEDLAKEKKETLNKKTSVYISVMKKRKEKKKK